MLAAKASLHSVCYLLNRFWNYMLGTLKHKLFCAKTLAGPYLSRPFTVIGCSFV